MEEFEIILNKIEELNDRAWNLRFEKTTLAKKYAQEAFDLSEKNNRITSYNVCYTKLLRDSRCR